MPFPGTVINTLEHTCSRVPEENREADAVFLAILTNFKNIFRLISH